MIMQNNLREGVVVQVTNQGCTPNQENQHAKLYSEDTETANNHERRKINEPQTNPKEFQIHLHYLLEDTEHKR
jgi:hypothetical protein